MARLTLPDRERIEKNLVAALTPADPAIAKLQRAAFDAVYRDYFGDKALRSFAAMPREWFDENQIPLYVKPTGSPHFRTLPGPKPPAPRSPPGQNLGEAAQKAVDAWAAAYDAQEKARRSAAYRVGSIVGRAATMQGLLKLLPEARDILTLPPEQDLDETAAAINATLAARKASPAAPISSPAPAKPAKTRPAVRTR